MADSRGLDWPDYLHSLQDDDIRVLACWLAAEGLLVGEFMEVVDRAYAAAPEPWRAQTQAFMIQIGQPAAERYVLRKRRFTRLMAMLEEALASGALAGEVAPQELELSVPPQPMPRSVKTLLDMLEHARHGQE